jgi:hypothetical protein
MDSALDSEAGELRGRDNYQGGVLARANDPHRPEQVAVVIARLSSGLERKTFGRSEGFPIENLGIQYSTQSAKRSVAEDFLSARPTSGHVQLQQSSALGCSSGGEPARRAKSGGGLRRQLAYAA